MVKKSADAEVLATAELLENKVIIWNEREANAVYVDKYFGKFIIEDKKKFLQLSLEEAMMLLEREHIIVKEKNKVLNHKTLYERCCEIDREFPQKFAVYKDLRNRGYIVKSGFKFGTHFRVYERGVNPYREGEKSIKEHTKYNVHAVPENIAWSLQEWSRYVRLSQNIRALALLAVVDEEGEVTYYKIMRIRP